MYRYSVIIPSLNEEKRIKDLITDLLSQTFKPTEIIVADKSTDRTPQIAKELGAKIVEGVNDYYIGRGRNNGAKVSTTDLLFFFDADCRVKDNEYVEKFLKQFFDKDLDLANSKIFPDKKTYFNNLIFSLYNSLRSISAKTGIITSDVGSGLMMKKAVFEKLNGYREDLRNNEDIDFIKKAIKSGFKYRIIDTELITSDRRMQNRNILELLLLFFSASTITILVAMGFNSKNKLIQKLEKIYWRF